MLYIIIRSFSTTFLQRVSTCAALRRVLVMKAYARTSRRRHSLRQSLWCGQSAFLTSARGCIELKRSHQRCGLRGVESHNHDVLSLRGHNSA